jgi:hypothetical protein
MDAKRGTSQQHRSPMNPENPGKDLRRQPSLLETTPAQAAVSPVRLRRLACHSLQPVSGAQAADGRELPTHRLPARVMRLPFRQAFWPHAAIFNGIRHVDCRHRFSPPGRRRYGPI